MEVAMKLMKANYPGTCRGCHTPFKAGDQIAYGGKGRTYHASCQPSASPRADGEYWAGRNHGYQYGQNKKLYGERLAEAWEMEDELRRYNQGLDD